MPTSFLRFSVYVGAVFSAERFIVIARHLPCWIHTVCAAYWVKRQKCYRIHAFARKVRGDTIFPNFIIFYRLVGGGDVNAHVSVLIFWSAWISDTRQVQPVKIPHSRRCTEQMRPPFSVSGFPHNEFCFHQSSYSAWFPRSIKIPSANKAGDRPNWYTACKHLPQSDHTC